MCFFNRELRVLLLQVGKDKRAQAFLGELDKHPEVGSR
jgi:hypothetical protein